MYFEVDDVKRRHNVYYDISNVHGWVDTPDSAIWWVWLRSAMAGVAACSLQAVYNQYHNNYKLLTKKYLPPQNIEQLGIYLKQIPKM